jgi:hypothetical protein
MSARYTIDFIFLVFREVKGPYIGENFTLVIEQVTYEYNISKAIISTFMLNNITPNDACINILGKSFG